MCTVIDYLIVFYEKSNNKGACAVLWEGMAPSPPLVRHWSSSVIIETNPCCNNLTVQGRDYNNTLLPDAIGPWSIPAHAGPTNAYVPGYVDGIGKSI